MEDSKNTSKSNDYKIPEDYFVDFQERLHVQIEFEKIVGTKKDTGFKVPDGYFASFAEKIEEHIKPEPKVIPLFQNKWMYAIASIAAILLFLFIILPQDSKIKFDSLESISIAEFLENDHSLISVYEYGELLTDEELDDLSDNIQLEDTELIDYLDITIDQYDLMTQKKKKKKKKKN